MWILNVNRLPGIRAQYSATKIDGTGQRILMKPKPEITSAEITDAVFVKPLERLLCKGSLGSENRVLVLNSSDDPGWINNPGIIDRNKVRVFMVISLVVGSRRKSPDRL